MTIVFQNCRPKDEAFLVLYLRIFLFARNVAFRKFWCWFQIWQYFFQIAALRYPNKWFFVPNLGISIHPQNYPIRQIWKHSFQLWQNYFQMPVQKYRNKAFWVPNLRICNFALKFVIRQIRGRWFLVWQYYFQIPVQNNLNKAFLVLSLGFFFSRNFELRKIRGWWF